MSDSTVILSAVAALVHQGDTFRALQDRLGISDEEIRRAGPADGEEYVPHAEFERDRYDPPTDCEGMLRIEERSGSVWIVVCDRCGFECGVQMRRADPKRLLEDQLLRSGIPDMFRGKPFDGDEVAQQDTLAAARIWLRQFKRGPLPAVALWGPPGRGKSHLLSLIVETLIRSHGVDAVYRTAVQLFDELQAGLDSAAYEIQWQRVLRVPVLALDDLGAGRMTEWRLDRFAALVDFRYSRELPLLVATNLPPARWEDVFGHRSASRLRGMVLPFLLDGPDRRVAPQRSLEVGV